jgi:hypothetical protein
LDGDEAAGHAVSSDRVRVREIDVAAYQRHVLHAEGCSWPETNCYTDVWVELVHALGLDPMPALAFTLAIDFEGDQYTFYKFSHEELRDLYGIEVQELNIWKPLLEHAREQIAQGRIIIPEVDAHWLPDTQGVSYRIDHAKTSVAMQDIDLGARRLGYFHNAGYHELSGEDFDGVFRLMPGMNEPPALPPYTEIAKVDRLERRSAGDLTDAARALLRRHVARRPLRNPIAKHREHFARDLEWLRSSSVGGLFHQYAFATFRQLGSGFQVAGSFLTWLAARGEDGIATCASECETISSTAKTMQFQLARAVTNRREIDFGPSFETMIASWERLMKQLDALYAR